MGQLGPHIPQNPLPPMWLPFELTRVEHQNPYLPKAHDLYVFPLNLKGKTHFSFGEGPATVLHWFPEIQTNIRSKLHSNTYFDIVLS